jgi:hypothetical protein
LTRTRRDAMTTSATSTSRTEACTHRVESATPARTSAVSGEACLEESQEERTDDTDPGIGSDISGTDAATKDQCANTGQTAYLNGQCRDGCGNPHAPGKPRCDTCHRIWLTTVDGYER